MPNFIKIGQSIGKLLQFFVLFQDGCRHHFGFSQWQNFIG